MPFSNTHNKYKLKYSAEEEFPDLSKHNNHMAKVLTPAIYQRLRDKETPSGFTLDDVIQTGVDNPGSPMAPLPALGSLWPPAGSPVAPPPALGSPWSPTGSPMVPPPSSGPPWPTTGSPMAPLPALGSLWPPAGSPVAPPPALGSPWPPMGAMVAPQPAPGPLGHLRALPSLEGEFKGRYYPLKAMTEAEQQQLIDDHFLFDKPVSPLLLASGMARDWPDARGIWHNDNKTFLVWVNEEDHLRVISMEKGGNMKEVFRRFCVGLKKIEEIFSKAGHPFMWTEHLGYILTCPSNLGTGLRGGGHVRLPKLSQHPQFEAALGRLRLQKRGTASSPAAVGAVFDISNADRLGFSEVEQVQMVVDGVKLMVEMEKKLEQNQPIDDMIPAQK
ncbi:Creatine kinase M-type [Tinamus guttatus]|uniref:Creatine kinase M-type n=1 Tax=Tinamus guttatus TaxID=94827 RepID=A0A099YWX4_TINGU|nr:Creatine kinase M-type [Tinamus guttatus]